MSTKAGYTIYMVDETSDPRKWGTASSTVAHYRRVKKFCISTSTADRNYERCGYNAGFTPDADGMYSFAFNGAPEKGTFNDFYDVCNMCMAEDHSEEFVVQFLREKSSTYVNMAVTFVKGLSEQYDGSVVFDSGKYARNYADGLLSYHKSEDEKFEIGIKVDFTWGMDNRGLPPKVVKCKGLCIDMPGVQMEIVGNFDASKNQHWDDSSRDFFKQTFNFRLDDSSEECYIRFARNHEEANKHGNYTILTRDFRQRFGGEDETNGIDLDFTIRHLSNPQPHPSMEVTPQQEFLRVHQNLMEPPVEDECDPPQQASPEPSAGEDCDPPQQEPEEKEVAFFDHSEHKLLLASENFYKDSPGAYCDACMVPMQSTKWLYRCPNAACDYCVHVACAQFPRTIQHPSHPEHTLKLLKLSRTDSKVCDACKGSIRHGLHYHCAQCDFDVHPVCPEEEEEDWDPSQHLDMTPEQYLAHQTLLLQQQTVLQSMQLKSARRSAALVVNSGRIRSNLVGGSRTLGFNTLGSWF